MSRARAGDLLAVVSAVAVALLQMRGATPLWRPLGGATVAVQILLALTLFGRRRAPVAVGWIAVAAAVVIVLAADAVVPASLDPRAFPWLPAVAPFAAYAATAYGGRWGLVPAVALVVVVTHVWALPEDSPWLIQGLVFAGGPTLLGLYVGARRRLVASLTERSERAERERHLLAERARAEERSRLAAEMHDVVTHRVSLMVLQAGALSLTSAEDTTRSAAEEIRATGSQAMTELRDLIGILRDGPSVAHTAGEAPAPGTLASLVDASGLHATLVEEGSAGHVSPVVGRTTYRIVQEALTNVRKHATGADVAIRVRYRPDGVSVSVRNGPGDPDPVLVATGSGVGLRGLRQRVELLDGTFDAGPDGDGGFRLEAELPSFVATSDA